MDREESKYLIPVNVSTRFEIIEGIGMYEIKIIFIATIVGLAIYKILGFFPVISSMVQAFAIIIPIAGAFLMVKKEPSTGLSILYFLKSRREYMKNQKLYLYRQGDLY